MISAQILTKYFGEQPAVRDASFEIRSGEVVGFLGLNGAGKTTILRMLAGDLLPTGGRILIDGQDLAERPRHLGRQVGFLPERPPLYPAMTVRDYLRYVARLRGVRGRAVPAAIDGAIGRAGLNTVAGRLAGELSHGFQKRVGIAQAIVHAPSLVILDEPTAGLDPVQMVEMRQLVRGLAGDHTVIVSSHHLPEVRETCDRMILLKRGEVVGSGTTAELSARISGSGGGLAVTLLGHEPRAQELLRKLPGVTAVSHLGAAGDAFTLGVQADGDARAVVARTLVESGFDLLRLDYQRDELEAVFIELTRDSSEGGGHA